MHNWRLFFFDGTWNYHRNAGKYHKRTHIQRLYETGLRASYDCAYLSGPGTEHGLVGRVLGGAFGVGAKRRVQDALKWNETGEFWHEGSERVRVGVFGYSRGAAAALHFTNVALRRGMFEQIDFLCLFDTVASFGIPIDLGLPFQRWNFGYRLRLNEGVDHCLHILAEDEGRSSFRPTLLRANGRTDLYSFATPGEHGDVGGSNGLDLGQPALGIALHHAGLVGCSRLPAAAKTRARIDWSRLHQRPAITDRRSSLTGMTTLYYT